MDEHELSAWKLPGYAAVADREPLHSGWAALWFLWGLTLGGLIVWSEWAYVVAGCFVAWGMLMGLVGWRTLTVFSAVISDWAESRFNDPKVEMAATLEMMEAVDAVRELDDFDEENIEIPDSPAQRQEMRDKFFAMALSIPWFMGLIHGVGVGGLLWALIALIPSLETSVASAAITGSVGGAVLVACIAAAVLAVVPLPNDALSLSLRQRLLVLVSPLLVVPALIETAALWARWYASAPSSRSNMG